MAQAESLNKFEEKGASGEKGATQLMPGKWEQLSQEILGYVAPFTEINERYVVTRVLEKWLNAGMSVKDISLVWNQGHIGKCSKGINKAGVAYDSCAYVVTVARNYKVISNFN